VIATRGLDLNAAATRRAPVCRRRSEFAALALGAACAFAPALGFGQAFEPVGGNLQKRVNGVLALMGYMLTPDVTTGSLSISNLIQFEGVKQPQRTRVTGSSLCGEAFRHLGVNGHDIRGSN